MGKELKILTPEAKAIELFNEALGNLMLCPFPSLQERKEKAKQDCFILITNIKIALYESEKLDRIPANCHSDTNLYYAKVNAIIQKF